MPLFMSAALVSLCLSYLVDRYMILRYYTRPPAYDATLMRWAAHLMPVMMVFSLAISFWLVTESL